MLSYLLSFGIESSRKSLILSLKWNKLRAGVRCADVGFWGTGVGRNSVAALHTVMVVGARAVLSVTGFTRKSRRKGHRGWRPEVFIHSSRDCGPVVA